MKLPELSAFLFPYRTHLEQEIVYLKEQLAQSQRRGDTLQYELTSMKKTTVLVRSKTDVTPVVPKGWDATRAYERKHRDTREAEPEIIQAGSDAGSEVVGKSTWIDPEAELVS
jgi:hypothetical protein